MCLDYLSAEAREVGKLYGVLQLTENSIIERLFLNSPPFPSPLNVDRDGWEHAESFNSSGLLSCLLFGRYETGFHMYECLKDAIAEAQYWCNVTSIIISFEWDDMRAQGMQDGRKVSVVGSRRPLEIVWDSRYR